MNQRWIRVNDTIINPANVTHVEPIQGILADGTYGPIAHVNFGDGFGYLDFEGEARDAVLKHFADMAIDLTPQSPDDREFSGYQAKGGGMDRAEWERTKDRLKSLNATMDQRERVSGAGAPIDDLLKQAIECEVALGY